MTSEYLLSITGLVLLSVVTTEVLPIGKTNELIKGLLRLGLYLVVLMPLFDFFIEGFSTKTNKIFEDYFSENVIEMDGEYINYCSEQSIESFEDLLEKQILQEYLIEGDISIEWKYKNEKIPFNVCIESIEFSCVNLTKEEGTAILEYLSIYTNNVKIITGG